MNDDRSLDGGAFAFLPGMEPPKLRAALRGMEFRTTKLLLRARRSPEEWTGPALVSIHREVFGAQFPEHAGRLRHGEALLGDRAGPPPEQLDALMRALAGQMADHLATVRTEQDPQLRTERAFVSAATDHAEMVRIHPFVDGNGRWARIATVAYLFDCGFSVGAIIRKGDRRAYIAALNRCIDNHEPGDLANLLLRGYNDAMRMRLQ